MQRLGGGVGLIGTVGSILKNPTATTFCSQNPTTSRMPVAKAPMCRRCAAEASLLPISVGRCLEAVVGCWTLSWLLISSNPREHWAMQFIFHGKLDLRMILLLFPSSSLLEQS